MEHSHVMGGSTAMRRIHCPGSLTLEHEAPEQAGSEFAERGSMLHAAMELLLTADPQTWEEALPLVNELKGQDMGFPGHEIDDELIDEKILPALEAWMDLREQWDIDDWFIEQRVSMDSVIRGAFGTADVIAKDTRARLHIIDWKFGDGIPVPAVANYGLGFYAGAAMYDEDPELVEFCENITGVVLHIVQPRRGSEEVLQSWETTEEWVEDLIEQAAKAMVIAKGNNPPTKPGSWCQFCRARMTCPAQQQMATAALSSEPSSMSSVELGKAMAMAQNLKSWISEVVKLAEREAEGGAQIPGFKLVNKRPTRVYSDPVEAEKRMKRRKLKVSEMYERKLLSPAKAQKLLGKALYDKVLSDIVVFHSSGLTLVPDSDKRQAVTQATELLAAALPDRKE